jgi:hypothetical protein
MVFGQISQIGKIKKPPLFGGGFLLILFYYPREDNTSL